MKWMILVLSLYWSLGSMAQNVLFTGQDLNGKQHIYTESGSSLIDGDYDWIQVNNWGWIICRKGKLRSAYSSQGKKMKGLQEVQYINNTWANSELIGVLKGGTYGFYDKSGSLIIDHQYDNASAFFEGIARVKKGNDDFFIDVDGQRTEKQESNTHTYNLDDELAYLGNGSFSHDDMEVFEEEDKKGVRLIDSSKVLISPDYDEIFEIRGSLIIVMTDDQYGVINTRGEIIVPLNHSYIYAWDL